ncbi:hypothetical protein [Candidatus Williamhamiltonella defendens]
MYLVKQHQALRDFVEIAGFNSTTGQGFATEETLMAAIEHLIEEDKMDLFNNWYRFEG